MQKILKKWGSSLGILFNREDVKINELNEGDIIDIELCKVKTQGEPQGVKNPLKASKEKK